MIKKLILIACCAAAVLLFFAGTGSGPENFFVVHYTTGEKWNKKLDYDKQAFFTAHSKFLSSLRKSKVIVLGMRYGEKGMICIRAKNLEEANDLITSDSAVKYKTFKAQIEEADVFYDGCLTSAPDTAAKKVTGVGGVFFKAQNVKALNQWYYTHLGLVPNESGSLMEFRESDDANKKAYLQWSPFSEKTRYFEPSQKQFMINYRVKNLVKLKEELEKNGVQILDTIEAYEYGKFLHIMDPEGNKIELWEPVDSEFTRMYDGKTTK